MAAAAEVGVRFARGVGLAAPFGSSLAFSWLDRARSVGRWHDAETLLPEIIDLFDSSPMEGYLGQAWGMILVRQGRLDEARPLIDKTRAMLEDSDWPSRTTHGTPAPSPCSTPPTGGPATPSN